MPPSPESLPTRPSGTTPTTTDPLADIRDEVARGARFLVTSHSRPDGDSVGSQVALALALRALGKTVRIVNRDPPPAAYRDFPGVETIEIAPEVDGDFDALFVMECSDLSRPDVRGLERYRVVNIDHHLGNAGYGSVNWHDASAAACAEMVLTVIDAVGVELTAPMATAIYLGILTDTGGFHHSSISARTFEVCRRCAEAGMSPVAVASRVYHSYSIGRLRLTGALLHGMTLHAGGRVVALAFDDDLLAETGASYDDSDSLINMPLSARQVEAVVLFKSSRSAGEMRVSLRSKGDVDVRRIAVAYGGGGHRNAAAFSAPPDDPGSRARIIAELAAALDGPVASVDGR
jgi:phosphoesterase RecJ-like protein